MAMSISLYTPASAIETNQVVDNGVPVLNQVPEESSTPTNSVQEESGTPTNPVLGESGAPTDQVQAEQEVQSNSAPKINHTPVVSAEQTEDISISAKVSDDAAITEVYLFYKTDKHTDYTKIPMTAGAIDGNGLTDYAVTIPQSVIDGANSLQYYIEASDGVNITRNPAEPSELYTVQISGQVGGEGPYLQITEVVFNSTGL